MDKNLLISFSLMENSKTLFRKDSLNQLTCLNGIRSICLLWVILTHQMYRDILLFPLLNRLDIYKMNRTRGLTVLFGSFCVDSFLLMGGLVLSYSYMNSASKGRKFNILRHYVHRCVRLMPVLITVLLFYLTLMKHVRSGPFPDENASQHCEKYWWSTLLFIQNYLNPTELCVGTSWYLSVDMQLFVFSPLMLTGLKKAPKATMTVLTVLSICSILSAFLTQWFRQMHTSTFAAYLTSVDSVIHIYYPTHSRASSWIMGLMLGYCIHKTKSKETGIDKNLIKQIVIILLWILSLLLMVTCAIVEDDQYLNEFGRFGSSLQMSLTAPAWLLSLSWIIFACVSGYGGLVNWFLSLPIFRFISKLSYSMVLTHDCIICLMITAASTALDFEVITVFCQFCGSTMLSLCVSLVVTLAIEYPFITLEQLLWDKKKKNSATVTC
ncbi:hypothetical protein ILUMI_10023 [Ignelater luminosus]|uniref:Acyltransferase 3 domain-containing protein n=1 Tax=Ignelater luminosus TaxID=2038154 RepID=A0A8K0CYP1_IGNLU|nr:hypothetical protein ILUMI_10023 [Ignelater luminosus]